MNCREFLDFLNEYLAGDLSAEERTEFDKHLAECPWCVAYLDNYRKTILLAKSSVSTSEAAKVHRHAPEELVQAILNARRGRPA
jgi:anti-sigma factor RsiW